MKHLPGSLRSLAEGFASDFELAKGFFPHLFNTRENTNYVGPIPDKKYFDLSFAIKKPQELVKFNEWYDGFTGDWNLKEELLKYCDNDVEVLRMIILKYHTEIYNLTGFSPCGFATAPACAHEFIKQNVILNYDLGSLSDDQAEKEHQLNEIAKQSGWPALNASEYYFARGALRGGRTETRCAHIELTPEQIAAGIRIKYQDIVSQYPFQQIAHKFPVGVPEVEVYDLQFKPCVPCSGKLYETGQGCRCPFNTTENTDWKKPHELGEPTKEYILEKAKTMGGIIYAEVIPPDNLYHPVLIYHDKKQKKTIATLEPITDYFTMVEFVLALENGYAINKVYRIDWYHMKEGLWAPTVKKLYLRKMMFSKNMPSPERQRELIDEYEEKFEMGEIMKKSFDDSLWEKSGAKKLTAKILLNSAWGKHAQRPAFDETNILDENTDMFNLGENLREGNSEFVSVNHMQHYTKLTTRDSVSTHPPLHDSYIPAAIYVSAYGRVQLWHQLHKLGKRAIYHDTDSISYVYIPGEYSIPEGDCLGDWETEYDNIYEFISFGPKSYAFKIMGDPVPKVKCKGVSLTHASSSIVHFDSIKENIYKGLAGEKEKIKVPQMFFKYATGKGMVSYTDFKAIGFDPDNAKGFYVGTYLYPFGYNRDLIN